jgi:hypothetical protein
MLDDGGSMQVTGNKGIKHERVKREMEDFGYFPLTE